VRELLVVDNIKYHLFVPKDEKELEMMVKEHFSDIFGENSLYFDIKPEFRSKSGIGSKPDGIILFFDKPSFYVVEIELARHPIHDHIIAQITRFNTALKRNPETRTRMTEVIYSEILSDPFKEAFIKSKVKGELFKFLTEVFSSTPIVVIIIDELTEELEEAVDGLPLECRIIEFKTFVREGIGLGVHAHLFEPLEEIQGPPPKHYKKWESMLNWVNDNVRDVVMNLKEDIIKLGNVTHSAHGRYYCFYKGKPSSKSIFAAFMLTKEALKVRIRTDPNTFKDPHNWTSGKIYKGWFFKQDQEREFKVTSKEQKGYAMELIAQSYAMV
jgi:predicted transport protein